MSDFMKLTKRWQISYAKKNHLHFTPIALIDFIDVRDKLDTLADDEENHNDDQDPGHAGLLHALDDNICIDWSEWIPFLRRADF